MERKEPDNRLRSEGAKARDAHRRRAEITFITMQIHNCTTSDIDEILRIYKWATNLQRANGAVPWPVFDRIGIQNDINEDRQWKIVIDNQIACIWTTGFSDPFIWEARNADPALYVHRLATHPAFRGNNLVAHVVAWAVQYAQAHKKQWLRMDTVGHNEKLIMHYENCGFRYLGLVKLKDTRTLPAHYHQAAVSLFEMEVPAR